MGGERIGGHYFDEASPREGGGGDEAAKGGFRGGCGKEEEERKDGLSTDYGPSVERHLAFGLQVRHLSG